jgi:hypothetical protein
MNSKSAQVSEWKLRNPERARVNARNSYYRRKRLDPTFVTRHQLWGIKARAKAKGIPFDLTVETVPPVPDFCPALGIPLTREGGKASESLPELDRLIPELGYIPSNVQWISRKANTIKNNATYEELRRVTEWFGEQLLKTHPM